MAALGALNEAVVACRRCPRLVEWRERVAREKRAAFRDEEYWGKPMPGFLGGSDLAVPAPSKQTALAADWIKDFTSTSSEKALQAKGNIPNATNLLGASVNERAASRSWFVPTAKHWVDVENGNILRNMLGQILTGKLSVKQAAQSASDNIASVLNQS